MKTLAHKLYQRLTHWSLAFILVISSVTAFAPFIFSQRADAASIYNEGFEAGTTTWFSNGGNISQAASGTGGVTSATGGFHASVNGDVFTRWGGYSSVFPANGYTTSVDVYIDTDLADGASDQRIDYSSAINNQSGTHRRDFIFHLGTNPTVAGEWLVNASNNAPGNPSAPGNVAVTQSGWYTLRHEFSNVGGVLSVTMSLVKKSNGTVLGTWTRSDPSDLIATVIGGNRYGWFISTTAGGASTIAPLAIDNATMDAFGLAAPNLIAPTNNAYVTGVSLTNSWSSVPGAAQYEYQSYHDADKTSIRWTEVTSNTSKTATNVADAVFWWRVRAIAPNGHRGDWSELWKVTVDHTKPSKPVLNLPSNGAYLDTNEFDFDWHDSTDASPLTYEFQASQDPSRDANEVLNGGSIWHSGVLPTSMIHSSGAGDGPWFYQVRAKDAAGNYSDWSDIWSVIIDQQDPSADLQFPGYGPSATGFTVVFDEDVNPSDATNPANYFLSNWPGAGGSGDLAGDANITYDVPTRTATVTFTNPGWYISPEQLWGVQNIRDLAGNLISPNPTAEYSSPMVAPTTPGVPTTATPTNSLSIDWTWTAATDPGAVQASGVAYYEYALVEEGDTPTAWTATGLTLATTTVATDGTYELYVRAVDNAGNTGDSAVGTVVIDTDAPTVTVDPVTTFTNTPTFTGTADDNDATLTISIDGEAPVAVTNNSGNWSYTVLSALSDGPHSVEVVATDLASNTGSDTESFTVDTTAPAAAITTSGTQTTATPVIEGTVDTDATELEFLIDGVVQTAGLTWTPGDTSWSFTGVTFADGTYTVAILARDVAGNEGGQSAALNVAVPAPDVEDDPETEEDESEPQTTVTPGEVLGEQDDQTDNDNGQDTAGATTDNVAQAETAADNNGNIFGLAWYWWLLILAGLAAIIWWIVAAVRRRGSEAS